MRILTVRQPYAWAIVRGGKSIENRTRNIAGSYRGPVAIHVAQTLAFRRGVKNITDGDIDFERDRGGILARSERFAWPYRVPLNEGHIIGVVDVTGVHHDGDCWEATGQTTGPESWICSPWAMRDHHHLVLANPREVDPIPYTGALGLRTITDLDVLARLAVPA